MPFVKLDCGMLNSTLWIDRVARELFITALLMAEPYEAIDSVPQIAIGSLDYTGWSVPPGWYGFVPAAGPGIIHRAGYDDRGPLFASAVEALRRLGDPEPESRSKRFDGRRLVRVDGGFIVLNFVHYREKDATTADRSRRWRLRQKEKAASRVTDTSTRVVRDDLTQSRRVVTPNDTIAEAEAEAEAEVQKKKRSHRQTSAHRNGSTVADGFDAFWAVYPNKKGKNAAKKAWNKQHFTANQIAAVVASVQEQCGWPDWQKDDGRFIPHPATWLNAGRWMDEQPDLPVAFTKAELDHAAEVRSRSWGGCRHAPRCDVYRECVQRIAKEIREKAT